MTQCPVGNCTRPIRTNGMCNTHAERKRLGRLLNAPIGSYKPRAPHCEAPECDKPVRARGLCSTHYARPNGDLSPIGPVGRRRRHGRYAGESYGVGWTKAKAIVCIRDGGTCRACGRPEEQGRRHHPIAHLVPRAAYPHTAAALANHPANLIVLCPRCHSGFDDGLLTRYDYELGDRLVWPVWTAQPAGHKLHLAAMTVCFYAQQAPSLAADRDKALRVLAAMPALDREAPEPRITPASFWDYDPGWKAKLQAPDRDRRRPQTTGERTVSRVAWAREILALYGDLAPER